MSASIVRYPDPFHSGRMLRDASEYVDAVIAHWKQGRVLLGRCISLFKKSGVVAIPGKMFPAW